MEFELDRETEEGTVVNTAFFSGHRLDYPKMGTSGADVVVPPNRVLVHNSVRPARRQGVRGFRFWFQAPSPRLEPCDCPWANGRQHFRVRRSP